MNTSDLEQRLATLIDEITKRNQTVQQKKQDGWTGVVVAVVLALVSLIGIGLAMYLAGRRSKELAAARTAAEIARLEQRAAAARAAKEPLLRKREELLSELKEKEQALKVERAQLQLAERRHTLRQVEIDNLRAWERMVE